MLRVASKSNSEVLVNREHKLTLVVIAISVNEATLARTVQICEDARSSCAVSDSDSARRIAIFAVPMMATITRTPIHCSMDERL
jgi:hypothetical protein